MSTGILHYHCQNAVISRPIKGLGIHRMVWIGRDLKDHLFSISLPWAAQSFSGQLMSVSYHVKKKEVNQNTKVI